MKILPALLHAASALFLGFGQSQAATGESSLSSLEPDILALDFVNGKIVAIGESGLWAMTDDFETWTYRHVGSSVALRSATHGLDRYVAVGDGGAILTSPDSIVWTVHQLEITPSLRGVALGNNLLVAVGQGGTIVTSDNGDDWTVVSTPTTAFLHGVLYHNGRFLAVGDNGTLLFSEDGETWELQNLIGSLRDIAFGNGTYIIVRDGGGAWKSTDGVNWEQEPAPSMTAVQYDLEGRRFVGVGGTTVQARSDIAGSWTAVRNLFHPLYALAVSRGYLLTGGGTGRMWLNEKRALIFSPFTLDEPPVLSIAPDEKKIGSEAKVYSLHIATAGPWSASTLPDWISLDPMAGEGAELVSVSVTENADMQDRTALFDIEGITHRVTQAGTGHRVRVRTSGGGEATITPDPGEQRWPTGTTFQITTEPAERFLGWSGADLEQDASVQVTIESDLSVIAHFPGDDHLLGANLNDLTVFNDRALAVGRSGAIFSRHHHGWSIAVESDPRHAPTPAEIEAPRDGRMWAGIGASDDRAVAVARDGTVAVSKDGDTWRNLWADELPLARVIFESGVFRAVGDHGTILSSTNGTSWMQAASRTNAHLSGIAYGGATWVAVGHGGTILTSPDANEWTKQTSGTFHNLADITYGAAGFVAVGGPRVLRSTNGLDWTIQEVNTVRLSAVEWGNGRYVAAGGFGDQVAAFVSTDGAGWVRHEIPYLTALSKIAYEEGLFYAVGAHGTVLSSANGQEWSAELSAADIPGLWGIATSDDGAFVAVGELGTVLHQPSGGEAGPVPSNTSRWLWDVVAGNGFLVAVGERGVILRSVDGAAWETVRNPQTAPRLGGVTFGDGRFIAVGDGGTFLTSLSGQNWEAGALPVSSMFWSVAYGEGGFVAVGENGAAAFSSNGLSWQDISFDEEISLHGVVYHEGSGFVIVGADGWTAHSPNGLDWETAAPVTEKHWQGVRSGGGWLVAVGRDGVVGISAEGDNWSLLHANGGKSLHDLIIDATGATAAGAAGTIRHFLLPPWVRDESGDVTVSRDADVVLSATVGGTEPLLYKWFHDDEPVPNGDGPVLQLTGVGREAIGKYRLEVINEAGVAESTPFFITVLTDYHEWAASHFGDPESPEAAPAADSTGSGVPNFLAYAFDADLQSARGLLPVGRIEDFSSGEAKVQYLTLTFVRSIGATDILYIPEASGDLEQWIPLGDEKITDYWRDGTREFVTVRDEVEVDAADGPRFLRLRVQPLDLE